MPAAANDDPRETLTERERQCLRLVFERLRPKEIGRALGISHHTVNGHLQQAMRKLGATSSLEAARLLETIERPHAPESVTGYPFGVEFPQDPSSLNPSHQGASGNGRIRDHIGDRVRDGAFGERWTAGAVPFVSRAPRLRWPLPAPGENRNDLTSTERILWIVAGLLAIAMITFMGAAAVESLQRTLQAIAYHTN
jgi:DNA-binding CsgD family transcriptional regulator